jgi:hypothetical protein
MKQSGYPERLIKPNVHSGFTTRGVNCGSHFECPELFYETLPQCWLYLVLASTAKMFHSFSVIVKINTDALNRHLWTAFLIYLPTAISISVTEKSSDRNTSEKHNFWYF